MNRNQLQELMDSMGHLESAMKGPPKPHDMDEVLYIRDSIATIADTIWHILDHIEDTTRMEE